MSAHETDEKIYLILNMGLLLNCKKFEKHQT